MSVLTYVLGIGMRQRQVFLLIVILFAAVNGRVYYMQNMDGNRYVDGTHPVRDEQSSRDLDLSFSAGDPGEGDNALHPVKKVWTLVGPEKEGDQVNKRVDWSPAYYKFVEGARTTDQDEFIVIPENNRKLVKINNNSKGEVILELRVIANHDSA